MDAKYLAEIKAREQAATPGPWIVRENKSFGVQSENKNIASCFRRENEAFIAHARTDIPELLVDNAAKDQQIATLKKALELACERNADYAFCGGTDAMKAKHAEANYQHFIHQAQE